MGFFDKKYCDICGEKIGLLGNRKLEDGNLCKNCAKKLSPWFSDRRSSTVQEIREQLDWREKNQERTAQFCATRSFGERTKLLLDETHRWFCVTAAKNPSDDNADVLDFSAITGCRMDVDERRTELKMETRDSEGKVVHKSYSPPRYEYDYDFYIMISVNLPYFNEMKFRMNDFSVHVPFRFTGTLLSGNFGKMSHGEPLDDPCYYSYKQTCEEICRLLENMRSNAAAGQQSQASMQGSGQMPRESMAGYGQNPLVSDSGTHEEAASSGWNCPFCGAQNHGNFCESCGAKRP